MIRFTQLLVGKFQKFSLDNSMVKKMYTCDDSDEEGENGGKKGKGKDGRDENELLFN